MGCGAEGRESVSPEEIALPTPLDSRAGCPWIHETSHFRFLFCSEIRINSVQDCHRIRQTSYNQ